MRRERGGVGGEGGGRSFHQIVPPWQISDALMGEGEGEVGEGMRGLVSVALTQNKKQWAIKSKAAEIVGEYPNPSILIDLRIYFSRIQSLTLF